jgi:DNA-binding FadR family transcriptional regulator
MSVEVRACLEIGMTDGSTAVRVLLSESVLRPALRQTTDEDLAMLARATLSRLAAEATEKALEQADTFVQAMAQAADAQMIVLDGDAPGDEATADFVASFPVNVRKSKHLGAVLQQCSAEHLGIGNVTREIVAQEVRRLEAEDPT